MAEELTVLLVSAVEPDENLVAQLEKQGVFAEQCLPDELSNMLALVEPSLVVQLGAPGAAEVVELLKTTNNVRRVRLVIVASRKDIPALRKLDRAVVVSLLATDIAPSVVATRISMLARKGPGKTDPPPEIAELPHPPPPAGPPRAVSKKPLTPVSKPISPLGSGTLGVPAPRKTLPRAVPPPTAVAAPPAALSPDRENANHGDKTPVPAPKKRPLSTGDQAVQEEPAPETVRASIDVVALSLKDANPRIALADSDISRADLIACALREAGISARLVPLEAAATRWRLLRSFRPNILLADSSALQGEGQIWYQLFEADEELRRAKVVSIPFERLFNEETGSVNLRTLVPQIPQLSVAPVKRPPDDDDDDDDDERPTLIHEPADAPGDELSDDKDRPPAAEDPPPEFEDETQAFDMSNLASEVDAEFAAQAAQNADPPIPAPEAAATDVRIDTDPGAIGRAAPLSLAQLPPVDGPPSEQSLSSSTISNNPPEKRSGRWLLVAAALVVAGGGLIAWKKGVLEALIPAPTSQAAPTTAPPPAKAAPPAAPIVEEKEPELTEEQKRWFLPEQKPVPGCPELVPNLEELSKGGIQQATLSWDRARKTMVLGDLDQAQVFMCEAALIHPESLALEGLAGLYVSKRAPKQAMEWTKKALAIRPDRRKTQELEGDVLSLLGRPAEARTKWIEALKIDDSQKTLDLIAAQYVTDAEFQLKGGAVSQAERLYRRAATLSPENAEAAAGLASAFLAADNLVAAEAWAAHALSIKPGFSKALVVKADLLNAAGENDKALALYQEILKTDPGNARAHQQIFKLEQE